MQTVRTTGGTDFQMYSPDKSSPPSSLIESPTSLSRARLRPFNYLRTYRQNYNHNHGQNENGSTQTHPVESRSTSYISPPRTIDPQKSPINSLPNSPSVERSIAGVNSSYNINNESFGATSGWLPTVGGQSGVSRIATEPQATATASSSALLSSTGITLEPSGGSSVLPRTNVSPNDGLVSETLRLNTEEAQSLNPNIISHSSPKRTYPLGMPHQLPSIRFSSHQDPRPQRPSLVFTPMFRILPSGKEVIKVGRYSERDSQQMKSSNSPSCAPIGFKSKVVSRRHCEFWYCEGSWFIKDVKSSSGTFLNHIRLSAPGTESRPFPVHDGDIVQLGIDFKGGEEMIFRCVKVKIELNKCWQSGPSSFNMQSHKRLCELNNLGKVTPIRQSQDCSICLGPIAPCQPLFVAPCSHTWHYKCIRVVINGPHWPHFICPNCRNIADLEAEIEEIYTEAWEEVKGVNQLFENENKSDPPIHTTGSVNDFPNPNPVAEKTEPHESNRSQLVDPSNIVNDENPDGTIDYSDDQLMNEAAYRLDRVHINVSSPPTNRLYLESTDSGVVTAIAIPSQPSRGQSSDQSLPDSTQNISEFHFTDSHIQQEASTLAEGPMTPRNNVGPYLFDGSSSDIETTNITSINLASTPETHLELTPPQRTEPRK